MTSFWIADQGEQLEQGDYLPGCWIPVVGADFDPAIVEPEISVGRSNLIIVTQSCDLANDKIQLAALCPIADLATWEQLNPDYAKRGFWEGVRQGRREGLHMVSALAAMPAMAETRWSWIFARYSVCRLHTYGDMRPALGRAGGCNCPIGSISHSRSPASSCASGCRRRFLPSNDKRAAYFRMTAKP